MESRLRLAGQAVHPLLLMFPLGLFVLAVIFDVAGLLGDLWMIENLAHCTLVAGLVGALPAAAVTWFDAACSRHPTVTRIGVLSFLCDLGVLVLYAVIAIVRLRHADRSAGPTLFVLEILGLGVAVFSAWFAGRLGGTTVGVIRQG
jgi:uncharacterized membrane protein